MPCKGLSERRRPSSVTVQALCEEVFEVKPTGVVCDDYRVIFMSGQALSAGMVGWVVTSSPVSAVSVTGRMRQRARTSRPR